ncbi:DUF1900-domain-containing protein [Nadsonia fulvescens var. elongata DSM 6958]|uniref:Coronin n=1 Tax=Nadsonia fulvescens var. elongata DSM 6958 TaxID=857566 RepID=A0A1E3PRL2_9ASCO|nr:DUF1900-domain-containing protein [Nadsonia fulvescens var. elongata DSM 6958]
MSRFVRASKYRHVYGQPSKREFCYDNIRVSNNAWDSNLIKANSKYISVNWEASGGGAFAVIPLTESGKLPDQIPLFRGHTGPVLDTDWNPFSDDIVASASDDGKVGIWKVPENFTLLVDPIEDLQDVGPLAKLSGHQRKVGHVNFHPVANNVLASSSADYTIKLWDIEAGKAKITLQQPDLITSFAFNYDGNLIATTCRDKKIRVWDTRSQTIVSEGPGHSGAKNSRVVWLGQDDRLATTGFSRLSDRQIALWNTTDIAAGPVGGFYHLDTTAGVCMPYYDDDTKCLYLAGKGDGNIRYFEYKDDELFQLSEYQSSDPQRGIAFLPKRALDMHKNEVVRAFKTVNDSHVEPISFIVPRRAETFQMDIYPDCIAGVPSLTADEWFGGKSALPKLISLEALFEGEEAKPFEATKVEKATPTPTSTVPAPAPGAVPSPAVSSSPAIASSPAAASPAAVPVASRESTPVEPKKDVHEALKTASVESLLNKAKESDEPAVPINRALADEASAWDQADDEPKVADVTPVETKPVETKPMETQPVEPVETKPVEAKPVDTKPVESGDLESRLSQLEADVQNLARQLQTKSETISKLQEKVASLESSSN